MASMNRRSGLATGVKLAFAVPTVLAALPVGTAAAKHTTGKVTTGKVTTGITTGQVQGNQQVLRLHLCSATQGSTLRGLLQVFDVPGTAQDLVGVTLQGGAAGTVYQILFTPTGGAQQLLGSVTLGAAGAVSSLLTLPAGITLLNASNQLNGTLQFLAGPAGTTTGTNQLVVCANQDGHHTTGKHTTGKHTNGHANGKGKKKGHDKHHS